MNKTLLLTSLLAAGSFASVQALDSISGAIGFGSFMPAGVSGGTGLGDATGIVFNNFPGLGAAIVNSGATGTFAGLDGSFADFFSFTFAPLPVGGADIWSLGVGSFSFHLDSVTVVQQNGTSLVLAGTGTVSHPAYLTTAGTFNLSMQGDTGDQEFSFSADNAVPDSGSSMALLGAALLGFGALSRRKA